jgi:hypothetical protein
MRSFHNSSFDPQTVVLLETAFDEAWLTLKSVGNKTVSAGGTATRCYLARGELMRGRSRPISRGWRICCGDKIKMLPTRCPRGACLMPRAFCTVADMQQDKQINRPS